MKKILLIAISFFLFNQFSFGQFTKIKEQLKQAFFELDVPSTKYDVRKLLHSSENFTDLSESTLGDYDMVDAKFTTNFKLSYITNATRRLAQFWYFKGTDNVHSFSFDIHYKANYVETCTQQFNELSNFFKSISYKTSTKPFLIDNVKKGDILYLYSSQKSFANSDAYIIIATRFYVVPNNITSPPPGEYYELTFSYYNSSLY